MRLILHVVVVMHIATIQLVAFEMSGEFFKPNEQFDLKTLDDVRKLETKVRHAEEDPVFKDLVTKKDQIEGLSKLAISLQGEALERTKNLVQELQDKINPHKEQLNLYERAKGALEEAHKTLTQTKQELQGIFEIPVFTEQPKSTVQYQEQATPSRATYQVRSPDQWQEQLLRLNNPQTNATQVETFVQNLRSQIRTQTLMTVLRISGSQPQERLEAIDSYIQNIRTLKNTLPNDHIARKKIELVLNWAEQELQAICTQTLRQNMSFTTKIASDIRAWVTKLRNALRNFFGKTTKAPITNQEIANIVRQIPLPKSSAAQTIAFVVDQTSQINAALDSTIDQLKDSAIKPEEREQLIESSIILEANLYDRQNILNNQEVQNIHQEIQALNSEFDIEIEDIIAIKDIDSRSIATERASSAQKVRASAQEVLEQVKATQEKLRLFRKNLNNRLKRSLAEKIAAKRNEISQREIVSPLPVQYRWTVEDILNEIEATPEKFGFEAPPP